MRHKIIFAMMIIASIVFAGQLPLEERNTVNGKVVQDNNTYNIVYYTETYRSDGSVIKRIIVEDENQIKALEGDVSLLFAKINGINVEFAALNANASEVNELMQNNVKSMELLNQQRAFLRSDVDNLTARKSHVDSALTGSVVMSPTAFRASLIVFVLLLIIVIAARTTGIFSRGRVHEKTPYEEE